jgi:hypothetical protein
VPPSTNRRVYRNFKGMRQVDLLQAQSIYGDSSGLRISWHLRWLPLCLKVKSEVYLTLCESPAQGTRHVPLSKVRRPWPLPVLPA